MTSLLVKSQLCVILSVELANPLGAAEFANNINPYPRFLVGFVLLNI